MSIFAFMFLFNFVFAIHHVAVITKVDNLPDKLVLVGPANA